MSVFASAASMPTRLPTTPAVGSGIPATGGGAGFSRPKPNRPRFFFSGAADGGGLHSSTGGVAGSGIRSARARGSALAGLPHGSADVALGDGAVQVFCVFCAGAGALHASFAGGGASAGGAQESRTGADDGGVPHGSSDAAGVAGAGGAVQRSAVGAGGALVPHWSGAAVGAHELPDGSAAGCSGSVGAGPKIPESALRRSSKAGGVSAIGGAIHSGAGAGVSVARPHCGATSEMGTGPLSLGVILQS